MGSILVCDATPVLSFPILVLPGKPGSTGTSRRDHKTLKRPSTLEYACVIQKSFRLCTFKT
ncbi:hypothetical protein BC936DRAFT_145874 [Jimgerdemannia flammicorona]|uniref:Uncharacterized protein n=1 Tax=Jimgerdemannia flammicorona TaxID=994334 RepID=A0A433D8X5_9FUNG|nr:hypothetical protein BC936DRAFT_145874 [Jimgerdemannia flammicorona]